MGENLRDLECGNGFFSRTPKTQARKAKVDRWDSLKLKNVCRTKEPINGVKRHEWEEIFENKYVIRG